MRHVTMTMLAAGLIVGGSAAVAAAGRFSAGILVQPPMSGRSEVTVSTAREAGVEDRGAEEISHRPYSKHQRIWKYDRQRGWSRHRGRFGRPYYSDRHYRPYYRYPGDYRDYGRYSRKYRSRPRFRIWVPGYWSLHGYINGHWTFGMKDRRGYRKDPYNYDCRYRC